MNKLVLWITVLLLLAGCEQAKNIGLQGQPSSLVVAQVGDKKIYEADIDFEIMSLPESMRYMMQDQAARAQILDVMIKREVVAQKAREMGLQLDPLIVYRMRKAEDEVLIQGVREWQHTGLEKPTEDEVKAYYDAHKTEFIIPKQIHARHILVADKQTAVEILKQLKADPESFSALAAQYSIDDSTKGRGGDLNWFSQGVMVKDFDKVAFMLTVKRSLSKPVKTKFGWHIIQWLGERAEKTPSFESVKVEVFSILEKNKLRNWIQNTTKDADISIIKAEYVL